MNRPEFPFEREIDEIDKYDIHKYWRLNKERYTKGFPIMFMTTPRMNFSDKNSTVDAYLASMKAIYPKLTASLTTLPESGVFTTSPFIKILTNYFMGLDGKDLTAKTFDIGESFYGYKQLLSGPIIDSIVGDTLSVRYGEGKFLPITNLHKLWMIYREKVGRGDFVPSDTVYDNNMIDFASTLYYFVLDMDLETILYYSRYVGVVPISTPFASLVADYKDSLSEVELTIEYAYSYKDDLNPEALFAFNQVATGNNYSSLSPAESFKDLNFDINYENDKKISYEQLINGEFSGVKIVKKSIPDASTDEPNVRYKLKFF